MWALPWAAMVSARWSSAKSKRMLGFDGLTAGVRPCFVEAPEGVVAAGATAASVAVWSESAATARPRMELRKDFTGKGRR